MSLFKYEAKNLEGKVLKGKIEFENEEALRKNFKSKGYYIISVAEANSGLNVDLELFKKIEDNDFSTLCREFYFSLSSGIPLLEALDMVKKGIQNKKLCNILENVYRDVEKGQLLSEAFKKHKEIPNLFSSMIEVGEETGNLDEIMNDLSEYYRKQHEQGKRIKNALVYPKFLFVFSIAIVTLLVVYIVPMFVQNLIEARGKLPLPTKIVMYTSHFLGKYGVFIFILIVIIFFVKKIILDKNKRYIYMRDKYLINSKILGNVTKMILTARFARTFSILFAGGISVIRCFEITAYVIGNEYIKEKLLEAREMVKRGSTIGEALELYNVFPLMIIKSIKIGERSGSLDGILKKSSAYYESEANFTLDKITKLIEPVMIIVLAFLVGFIVVSIMMPIFAMYNAVN